MFFHASMTVTSTDFHDSNLQLAKRRAEREAADLKQQALKYVITIGSNIDATDISRGSLEREVERLRNRLDRPSSVLSPASSPRKFDS